MLTLLKDTECYCPQHRGQTDILIAGDRILKLGAPGTMGAPGLIGQTIPCGGLFAFPGLIDQHVHIIGGGGEQGFPSRIPEISAQDIVKAGVTTLVGLLGADASTKTMEALYAKAKALEYAGITTYIYSGSYALPPVTLMGSITRDLVFIDKVIGAGEIAISDHRSSQPSLQDMLQLSSATHLGGLAGGKAGIVHIHIGDGKGGLSLLRELIASSDLPIEMFVPTHNNRNPSLFKQAVDYCHFGGNIDLTAGETAGVSVPQAAHTLFDEHIDLSRVTVSSDANGSVPGGGVTRIQSLYDDIKNCVLQAGLPPETAFRFVTENPAKILRLYPKKGIIREGSDADILVTDKNYNVRFLIGMGKILYRADHP